MACECNSSIKCPCTASCGMRGKCCECVAYHVEMRQFPACFFSAEGERKHDRGFEMLLKDRK